MKKDPPNRKWFEDQIKSRGLNLKETAKSLKRDPTVFTRILTGERKFTLEVATGLARLLSLPLEDVLKNARIATPDAMKSPSVKIVGWVDGELTVHDGAPRGPAQAPCPLPGQGTQALRCQTAGSRSDGIDGALLYFQPSPGFNPECLGRLCVVKVARKSDQLLRVLKRGYDAGNYNLHALNGELLEEGATVVSAYPIIWMKL